MCEEGEGERGDRERVTVWVSEETYVAMAPQHVCVGRTDLRHFSPHAKFVHL